MKPIDTTQISFFPLDPEGSDEFLPEICEEWERIHEFLLAVGTLAWEKIGEPFHNVWNGVKKIERGENKAFVVTFSAEIPLEILAIAVKNAHIHRINMVMYYSVEGIR